ncbi:hypothetical protein [Candidatus Stoquefichus massiliensis]|uniref:hypothetical protein n=1 Tax=Candidatus Stoquefichus massiliensis TaxID=1470350 RepID=UPI0004883C85|nr:hypothetical protein [Candidatus Stoquefichus massiliensis]
MDILYMICRALSVGVIGGFLVGSLKFFKKKDYSNERSIANQKFVSALSFVLKYITSLCLILGLVWCTYFLILGACVPSQIEYANNMAELIVSVLTVISIIFAFVEFIKRKND